MNMIYGKAFNHLVQQAKWVCRGKGDVYANYEWLDDRPKPTKKQCDNVLPGILAQEQLEETKLLRKNAFQAEADPLFFGWQRGENTEEAWLDKVKEIRARYPYPS